MSEAELGRRQQESKKTPGYVAFKADCNKSNALRDTIMRGKRVCEEDKLLMQAEAEATKEVPAKKAKKSKQSKEEGSKGKGKDAGSADSKEMSNVIDLLKDERRRNQLIITVHCATGRPITDLQRLDLDELEKALADTASSASTKSAPSPPSALSAPSAPSAPSGANKHKTKAKALTSKAKGPSGTAFKTPTKKLTASKVVKNSVTLVSSPLVAFEEAQEQSAQAALPMPVPKKRKPKGPLDNNAGVRRLRLDQPVPQIHAQPKAAAPLKSQTPSIAPRANSTAPSAPSTSSGPFTPSADEDADLGNGPELVGNVGKEKPTGAQMKSKRRPTKKDCKDTVEFTIIDVAVDLIWRGMVPNMCQEPDEYALAIAKGWRDAIKSLELKAQDYPLSPDSKSVIRGLLSLNRSRGCKRVAETLVDHFKLHVSPETSLDDIKAKAAALKPTEFHRQPEAKGKAGLYRNPFVSRAMAAYWYAGANCPGVRYPEVFKPVQIESVAFICSSSEDILGGLARDGQIMVEVKAKKGKGKGRKAGKKPKGEIVPRANPDAVKALMQVHVANLQTFKAALPGVFKDYMYTLHSDALKWAGKPTAKVEVCPELAAGVVTADAFADKVDIPIEEVKL